METGVVNLPCFQEKMMVKEDPIKIGEEKTIKKSRSRNCVTVNKPINCTQRAVDRPVDSTQQRGSADQIFNRHKGLSTGAVDSQ